jgi:hypothetical protein
MGVLFNRICKSSQCKKIKEIRKYNIEGVQIKWVHYQNVKFLMGGVIAGVRMMRLIRPSWSSAPTAESRRYPIGYAPVAAVTGDDR